MATHPLGKKTVNISLNVPLSTKDQLKTEAARLGISVNALVSHCLDHFLAPHNQLHIETKIFLTPKPKQKDPAP